MAKKRVTLQMIADRADVSVVTVSNVLAGRKGAGEDVRKRVLALAQQMGYPSGAQAEREPRRGERQGLLIGVLIAERYLREVPSFYMDIYRQVAREASERRCLTLLEVVGKRQEYREEERRLFGETRLDGLFVIGQMQGEFVEWAAETFGAPLVCVDFYDVDREGDYVITDGFGGTAQLTRCLIGRGFRNILFLGNPEATESIMDRYMGYCKAMTMAGLTPLEAVSDRSADDGYASLSFELPQTLPEAFVCNCEKTSRMLTGKLAARGLRVPEDVAVASFDRVLNREGSRGWISYESDEASLARIAVSTLLRRIGGEPCPFGVRMVEGRLVEETGEEA